MLELVPILGGCVVCRPARVEASELGLTLLSDLHIGAAHVDYKHIIKELDNAKKLGDRICINGDVFDMILPKDQKRFDPDVLHPRLQGTKDVMGKQIEWGAEILGPYADNIDMIGLGNHETSCEKYHSIDPLSGLLAFLNAKKKDKNHIIHYGGYTGFIDYRFGKPGKKGDSDYDSTLRNKRFVIWYHHGSGGGSPVTKGMIDLHRTGWINADLIWMGHKHVRVTSHIQTLSCPLVGHEPVVKDVRQVITGAYFQTYRGQSQESIRDYGRRANYASDRGFAPSGNGGARLELKVNHDGPIDVKLIQ